MKGECGTEAVECAGSENDRREEEGEGVMVLCKVSDVPFEPNSTPRLLAYRALPEPTPAICLCQRRQVHRLRPATRLSPSAIRAEAGPSRFEVPLAASQPCCSYHFRSTPCTRANSRSCQTSQGLFLSCRPAIFVHPQRQCGSLLILFNHPE